MRRLLMVTTIPSTLCGFLAPYAHFFRTQGWQVDAMAQGTSSYYESMEAFDQVWDVEWSRNPLDARNLLRTPYVVREVVAREKYDLVHVHTPVASFVTRYAIRGLRRNGKPKVIYTAHGFFFFKGASRLHNAIFSSLEKLAGRWTDYLVIINHEDEEATLRNHIVPPERLCYMPGIGLDTQHYSPKAISEREVVQMREELGLSQEERLFTMVAEFVPNKCHQHVLKAFACLGRTDVHLALAGDGPLMEPTKRLATELGISDQVHFLGFRRDIIRSLIRASIALLLSSRREGLPRSVMEALSLEVPVIGTDIRGVRDLLDENNGILVEFGDIEGLTQAMAWMLDHPKEARAMGRQGRERVVATHDLCRLLTLHEALYTKALES